MSRGTVYSYAHTYLERLRAGPVLAHEFRAPCHFVSDRINALEHTLPANWVIKRRWVVARTKWGLIREREYQLVRTENPAPTKASLIPPTVSP